MEKKKPRSKRYPAELRERAVRMVLELRQQDPADRTVVSRCGPRQLGVGDESLRSWVKQAEIDIGRRHLEAVLTEYLAHYNGHRPHRSLCQRSPQHAAHTPTRISDVDPTSLRRVDLLGGLIHEYQLVA